MIQVEEGEEENNVKTIEDEEIERALESNKNKEIII
jgi:hypothetical protein